MPTDTRADLNGPFIHTRMNGPFAQYGRCVTEFLRSSRDEGAVRRFARSRLAGYKVPGRIVVVAGIPRLDSGKVDLAAARTLAIGDRGREEQGP
jgi:acyl-CoA synthetase (AMP-forming)/AMP-acid ligase II